MVNLNYPMSRIEQNNLVVVMNVKGILFTFVAGRLHSLEFYIILFLVLGLTLQFQNLALLKQSQHQEVPKPDHDSLLQVFIAYIA